MLAPAILIIMLRIQYGYVTCKSCCSIVFRQGATHETKHSMRIVGSRRVNVLGGRSLAKGNSMRNVFSGWKKKTWHFDVIAGVGADISDERHSF